MKTPTLLATGFRPWFLIVLAGGSLLFAAWGWTWLAMTWGQGPLLPILGDWRWHAHEMIFGIGAALVAGFLLTAVQNWTGRRPLPPAWLLVSVLLWLGARFVLLAAGMTPWIGFVLSAASTALVAIGIARVIVAQRQWRNLIFPLNLLVLVALDLIFRAHLDQSDLAGKVAVLGIWPLMSILLFISQRILPAFTGGRLGSPRQSLGRLGATIFALAPLVLMLLSAFPASNARSIGLAFTALVLLLTGVLGIKRWWHPGILHEPMLLVLHAGFAMSLVTLPLLTAAWLLPTHLVAPIWQDAGVHAFGLGLLGIVGPGMVLRVSAGHTGRMITMPNGVRWVLLVVATLWLLRIATPVTGYVDWLLGLIAIGMSLSYLVLLSFIGPWLTTPRADGRPG